MLLLRPKLLRESAVISHGLRRILRTVLFGRDSSSRSIVPITVAFLVSFGFTTYIGLDQAFGISRWFLLSGKAEVGQLRNIALWVLSVLWPYL